MSLTRRAFLSVPASVALCARQTAPDELDKLLRELEATRAQYYNVPREDGQFLNLLVKVSRSKRILEIGSANGYSGSGFHWGSRKRTGI